MPGMAAQHWASVGTPLYQWCRIAGDAAVKTQHSPNVVLMLVQGRRRWANLKTSLLLR